MPKTPYKKSRETQAKRNQKAASRARKRAKRQRRKVKQRELRQREMQARDKAVTKVYGRFGHGSCGRKVRYGTEAKASNAARRIERHTGKPLFPYRCHLCGGWHLTSHPWKTKEAVDG